MAQQRQYGPKVNVVIRECEEQGKATILEADS